MIAKLYDQLEDLVIANRILAREGVVDGFGHISMRHPERTDRFFMSSSRSPELVSLDDIMEFDLDCNPIDHARGRTLYGERPIHGAIYRCRRDVGSVVHNHAHEVSPIRSRKCRCVRLYIRPGEWEAKFQSGIYATNSATPICSFATSNRDSLGDNAAALMRGHGCVVTGRTVRDAVRISVYLMVNARLQTEAMGFGEVTFLSENEIAATAEMSASPLAANRIWEYWVRRSGYERDATLKTEL